MFKTLSYSVLLVGIILALTALWLIPFSTVPKVWVFPDLTLALALLWSARLPHNSPVAVIALLLLLQDFTFDRPPGLYAGLGVIAFGWVKRKTLRSEEFQFVSEWATFAIAVFGIFIAYRAVLWLTVLPVPSLSMRIIELAGTIGVYPLLVGFCRITLGLRRYHADSYLRGELS